jgi:GNAT superfamily N-acetyltransferase
LTTARRATAEDLPRLSATLALAFVGYPWTDWTVAADDRLRRLTGLFARDLRTLGLEFGKIWVAGDGAAVAVWMPPVLAGGETGGPRGDADPPTDLERETLIGGRLPQAREAEIMVEARCPRAPHWHLAALGVRPVRQGEGLGSLVLGPMLERCGEGGIPAYTETSARRNIGFYHRHGFGVVGELKVPDGGPLVWLMRRDPR